MPWYLSNKSHIMKRLIVFLLSITTFTTQAQVYISENIHNGTNKKSYSVLTNHEGKEIGKSLEAYLGQFGKISKPEKNIYRIQNLAGNNISPALSYIDVVSKSGKSFEKLEFFFLDKSQNAIQEDAKAEAFVQTFIDLADKSVAARLLAESVSIAEDELKEAEKEVKKIEKSISSNLKDQEKLGKKLDASPDQIAQAMAAKEEIVSQIFSDSTIVQDEKAQKNLSKASQKKDREIEKIEKGAKKAGNSLSKKEDELESLQKDLASAKAKVKAQQAVLNSTKLLVK